MLEFQGAPVDLGGQRPPALTPLPAPEPIRDDDDAELTPEDIKRREKILAYGLETFKIAEEAERAQRDRELADLKFEIDQWPEEYRTQRSGGVDPGTKRKIPARPCLQIDKIEQSMTSIVNEARAAKLGIIIKPLGERATKEIADVRQGLIRSIEVNSRAQIARMWALDRTVKVGRGVYRITKQITNDGDFDMDLVVQRVLNQHGAYFDPFAQEPDWSDGEWVHLTHDIPEPTFKRTWPKAQLSKATTEQLVSLGDTAPGWVSLSDGKARTYRVSEFYFIEHKSRWLIFINTSIEAGGGPRFEDEVKKEQPALLKLADPSKRRKVDFKTVRWVVMNGMEILDEETWEGRWIPVIRTIGKEYNIGGERIWKGVIANAKDAQRSYNVMRSRQLEAIGLSSLAQWIMAEGQDEDYETQWDEANTRYFTRLIYKPVTVDDKLAPPPHRDVAEPAIQAITEAVHEADNDIKATTMRFDASLGNVNPRDRSGKAIRELKMQGETGTSNYLDNLASISMVHEGRILNDMLEHVYDRKGRIVRLLGDDESERVVMLNRPYAEEGEEKYPKALPPGAQFDPEKHKNYELGDGTQFQVVVAVGPAVPTQIEAEHELLSQLAEAAPELVPMFADLWVGTSPSPRMRKIAERLKKANPIAADEDEGKKPLPPEVQKQLAEAKAITEQAVAKAQDMELSVKANREKAKSDEKIAIMQAQTDERLKMLEIDARYEIENLKAQVEIAKALATMQHEQGQTLLNSQIDRLEQERQQRHDRRMAAMGHAQTIDQSREGHAQALDQQEQTHGHALEQQEQAADLAPEPAPSTGASGAE